MDSETPWVLRLSRRRIASSRKIQASGLRKIATAADERFSLFANRVDGNSMQDAEASGVTAGCV